MVVSKYNKLYWCDDGIGYRSQCVIATSMREAKRLFSKISGGYMVDTSALRIMRLPKQYQGKTLDWQPEDSLYKECDIVIITNPRPCTTDPLIQKLAIMAKRQYDFSKGRVFWFKGAKSKYVLQERVIS